MANLWSILAFLLCPLGMGLAMWFMMRESKGGVTRRQLGDVPRVAGDVLRSATDATDATGDTAGTDYPCVQVQRAQQRRQTLIARKRGIGTAST